MLNELLPHIETELQKQIARLDQPRTRVFHDMLRYHMGWTGVDAGPTATGKRIRPLMLLLTSAVCGGDWKPALPAAAAVELVHNFSLVHDDIQDNSPKRRGRLTVWKKWGAPQAINAGDALFVIANEALRDLEKSFPPSTVLRALSILQDTCLELTRGQFLDMSYQSRKDLKVDDYWPMVAGKTAALIAASTHIGALLGKASENQQEAFRKYGHHLGLAFQIQDDILGIWGNEAVTGKSSASDLVEGKNSLPILFGLAKRGKFARRWKLGPIKAGEVKALAALLADEGARSYAAEIAQEEMQIALAHLEYLDPRGRAGEELLKLTNRLLKREQ